MITASISNYVLNKLFGKSAVEPSWPDEKVYLGLSISSTSPDNTGTGFSEPVTGESTGYCRIDITTMMGRATDQTISSTEEIHFYEAQVDWGTAYYFGIFTSTSSTNPIFWGSINDGAGQVISQGDVAIIPKGQLSVTLQ